MEYKVIYLDFVHQHLLTYIGHHIYTAYNADNHQEPIHPVSSSLVQIQKLQYSKTGFEIPFSKKSQEKNKYLLTKRSLETSSFCKIMARMLHMQVKLILIDTLFDFISDILTKLKIYTYSNHNVHFSPLRTPYVELALVESYLHIHFTN